MACNRELIEQARALGAQLGAPVATQGLNNAKLTALVESLQQRLSAQSEVQMPAVKAGQQAPQPANAVAAESVATESFINPDPGYPQPSADAKPLSTEPLPQSPIEATSEAVRQESAQPTELQESVPPQGVYSAPVKVRPEVLPEKSPTMTPPEVLPPGNPNEDELDLLRGGKAEPRPFVGEFEYTIAPGHSLICLRGCLSQFSQVLPSDLSNAMQGIEHHIQIGTIIRNPSKNRAP